MIKNYKCNISLIIPAYQAEQTLAETLDSALSQSFDSYEVIVVDDGSHDGTLTLAQIYESKHSNLRVIHQENKGTGGAYNTGVQNSEGEWISVCSADDILYPTALSTLWQAHLDHPEMGVIASRGHYWYEDGRKIPSVNSGIEGGCEISLKSAFTGCFYSVGALYKRTWYDEVGGYNEGIFAEDYDFWLRIMMEGARVYYIDDILSANRRTSFQKSANCQKVLQTDISIFSSWLTSGKLMPELAEVCRDSILNRQQRLADLNSEKKRNGPRIKISVINYLVTLFGREKLEHLVHFIKGKN